jgi:predicted metal-dependent enzyme (double-stranded beta helix superfamily)
VIYEDNEVRVLSVKVAPGEKEVPHHHRWPSVIVFVDAPKRENRDAAGNLIPDRSSPEEKRASPMVVRMPAQAAHSVTNLDTTSLHLIRIEYKNGFPGAPANP